MGQRILVVDDDPDTREILNEKLAHSGYDVTTVADAESALQRLAAMEPDLVISDIRLPGIDGLSLLRRVREDMDGVDVVVITGHEDMNTAIEAMRSGAFDYVVKPVDLNELDSLVERVFREQDLRTSTTEAEVDLDESLTGRSPRMIEIFKMIGVLAGNRTTVFIRGETGTGKERIARAIHQNSPFADEPFVPLNCTALSDTLLESELFGHVRGAYTGALKNRKGFFEQAGAGTILLDEIGDTTAQFQAKLLRVLEEREFFPVGGESLRRTEARIITSTNRDVEQLVEEGVFRRDLYFRLKVLELEVPPLRERIEDIPLLCEQLLKDISHELHNELKHLTDGAMELLMSYDWPGNVRELENTLTRAAVLARGSVISADHLALRSGNTELMAAPTGMPVDECLDAAIAARVQRTLYQTRGNKSAAARKLKISRSRLHRLIKKYDLAVPE